MPEDEQRPLVGEVEHAKRGECTCHATTDVSAPAKIGHVKANRAGGREHNTPAEWNHTYARESKQPATREIPKHRQRCDRYEKWA
jgi:hypothetical protein